MTSESLAHVQRLERYSETVARFAVAGIYILARAVAFAGAKPALDPDSHSYLLSAKLDVFSAGFLAGPRAWTVPLLYKLAGHGQAAILTQFLISLAAWLFLADQATRSLANTRWRVVCFGSVLVIGAAPQVTLWDGFLLSDSLSLSLAAMLVGLSLWFVRSRAWSACVAVLVIALLWSFSRDSNAYMLLFAVPGLLLGVMRARARDRVRTQLIVLLVGFIGIFAASYVSAQGGGMPSARLALLHTRSNNVALSRTLNRARIPEYALLGDGRTEFPLLNVIGIRILTDRGRVAYFRDHGMPVSRPLLSLAGQYASGRNGAFYADPRLAGFRRWLYRSGQATYLRFLASHPIFAVKGLGSGTSAELAPSRDIASEAAPLNGAPLIGHVLPDAVQSLLLDRTAPSVLLWLALTLAALFLAATRLPRTGWPVAVTLLLIVPAEILVIWHGDTQSPDRHGLTLAILFRVAVVLLLCFAGDGPGREHRPWARLPARRRPAKPGRAAEQSALPVGMASGA